MKIWLNDQSSPCRASLFQAGLIIVLSLWWGSIWRGIGEGESESAKESHFSGYNRGVMMRWLILEFPCGYYISSFGLAMETYSSADSSDSSTLCFSFTVSSKPRPELAFYGVNGVRPMVIYVFGRANVICGACTEIVVILLCVLRRTAVLTSEGKEHARLACPCQQRVHWTMLDRRGRKFELIS